MTEVGMTISSVMFLNQDGRAPFSTHPARAHKHTAPQTVPKKHQDFVEKMPLKESILRIFSQCERKILPGTKILSKCDRIYSTKVRFWHMNTTSKLNYCWRTAGDHLSSWLIIFLDALSDIEAVIYAYATEVEPEAKDEERIGAHCRGRKAMVHHAPGQKPRHGSERNYLWRPTLPSRCLSAMCPMPTNSSRVL